MKDNNSHFNGQFPGQPEFQTILDFAMARDEVSSSGDNLNTTMCKAPLKSLSPTCQHSVFQARCPCRH